MFSGIKKIIPVFMFAIISIFTQMGFAQNWITIHEGMISIIRPDGVTIPIGKNDAIPKILAGSIIDLQEGSVEIALDDGFMKVIAVDSVAMIKAGDRIVASIYPKIHMIGFYAVTGNFDIITGNLKTSLMDNQEVRLGLDKFTGVIYIQSIYGNIVSFIAGARIQVLQNGGAEMNLNPLDQNLTVTSTAGTVYVSSAFGEDYTLNQNDSINIKGIMEKPQFADSVLPKTVAEAAAESATTIEEAAAGSASGAGSDVADTGTESDDLTYFVNLPAEEPPEPEIVEASPYLP